VRTLVWRRLDEPGMEVAHARSLSDSTGVQIGSSYELEWRLEGDRLELELDHVRYEVVHRSSNRVRSRPRTARRVGWLVLRQRVGQ
jgi:hypothetical protein